MLEDDAASTAAKLLAARRRLVHTTCAVCGQPTAGTTKRRYCGNACRQRAKYQRQKAAAGDSRGTG